MNHIADNQDALLDYLYDEGDPAERLAIAKHLQECVTCSVAVLELRTVRGMLAEWKPPAAQLGFRIVQDHRTRPSSRCLASGPRARGGWSRGWRPVTLRELGALRPPPRAVVRGGYGRVAAPRELCGWRRHGARGLGAGRRRRQLRRHGDPCIWTRSQPACGRGATDRGPTTRSGARRICCSACAR